MTDQASTTLRPAEPAPIASLSDVDHLHFDRRARVWLTHAELIRAQDAAVRTRGPARVGGTE